MDFPLRNAETKEELIALNRDIQKQIGDFFKSLPEEQFFSHAYGGWSAAENMIHISFTTNVLGIALRLPVFLFQLFFGKYEKISSREMLELKDEYFLELAKVKDSGIYTPKHEKYPGNPKKRREHLLEDWDKSMEGLIEGVQTWELKDMLNCSMPHPVMDKVTIKEMIYLSLLHSIHHSKIMEKKIFK